MQTMTGFTALVIWATIVGSLQEMDAAYVHSRKVFKRFRENNEVVSAEESPQPGDSNPHLAVAENHHVKPNLDHEYDDVTWPEFQCSAQFGSFQCTSGQCILLAFRCDHNVDCDDESDEEGCESHMPNWINPDEDQSIPTKQQPDDASDDRQRPQPTSSTPDWHETQCLDSELFFRCSTGRCIFAAFRCDGDSDCEDASDERDCASGTLVALPEADGTTTSNLLSSYRLSEVSADAVGRLEVYHDGRWGTVCDDSFGDTDAKVACVSLGYERGVVATNVERKKIDLLQPIWLDDVDCDGTESSLEECRHAGWGKHNCGHVENVYIKCSKSTEDTTTVSSTKETQTAESAGPEDSESNEDTSGSGSGSGNEGGSGSGNDES